MKSLQELRELRDNLQKDMTARSKENKVNIIIGMGTCGIAAGARKILQAVMREVDKRNIEVVVSQTGCIGMCEKEPLMDVKMPGKERVTYGNLSEKDVEKIIVEHVINGSVVKDLAVARLEEGGE